MSALDSDKGDNKEIMNRINEMLDNKLAGVNIFFFFGNSTLVADCDLRNSTLASKAIL